MDKSGVGKLLDAWGIVEEDGELERLRDDDLTVKSYMNKSGISEDATRRKLQRLVKAGKLVAVPCISPVGRVYAYRVPDGKP